ncbi:citrate lyase subunit beta / citryl-CoA lyase [Micromonospora coriariae]|uniref:Citrate lyase subunit beta / citryl-CoA lyase n=1 Tax=Micromonospora coriariae TaxID=285665 RepID=A0A1C4U4H5_9ACTN|nr:CoA ester lyase [Micromonospora coriariae]SCE66519.1 citrate lyase subunit beta / citryl-CoA lyase [Micromonospora coriariae]
MTPRSWLYVPGHRADRVAKALAAGADAVVVDLEDAVPPDQKTTARETALRLASQGLQERPLWVRVNDPTGPWGEDDIDALAGLELTGLRVPRCEDPAVIREVATRAGLPLQLLLESAAGLARAAELATAHPLVAGLGLGEADLSADLRVTGDDGLAWARGWVVVAARAAGLPSPVQSVYTDVADLDGLRASTERARANGFVGRSVVHPRQIPVVHEVFTPTAAEVASARAVVSAAARAQEAGEVAVLDADGRFVDPAVVRRARLVHDLTEPSEPPSGGTS